MAVESKQELMSELARLRGEVALFEARERKRTAAEEELAKRARFPDEDPNPALRISRYGGILYSNKPGGWITRLWGCEEDQPIPDPWLQHVVGALENRQTQQVEFEADHHVYALMFAPVWEGNYVNVYAMDVGLYKRQINDLTAMVARCDRVITSTGEGTWEMPLTGEDPLNPDNHIYYSSRFKQLVGYRDHEFENVLRRWLSRLRAEDKDKLIRAFSDHLERQTPLSVDYPMRIKAGNYRLFRTRGLAVRDESGRPLWLSGTLRDIAEEVSPKNGGEQSARGAECAEGPVTAGHSDVPPPGAANPEPK